MCAAAMTKNNGGLKVSLRMYTLYRCIYVIYYRSLFRVMVRAKARGLRLGYREYEILPIGNHYTNDKQCSSEKKIHSFTVWQKSLLRAHEEGVKSPLQ